MPGQKGDQQQFSLTTTFTPNGRPNLGGVHGGGRGRHQSGLRQDQSCSESRPTVPGPQQVQSKLNGSSEVADVRPEHEGRRLGHRVRQPADGAAGRRACSTSSRCTRSGGNAQLPAAEEGGRLVRTSDGTTAFENTLRQALDKVFGAAGRADAAPPPTGRRPREPPATGDSPRSNRAIAGRPAGVRRRPGGAGKKRRTGPRTARRRRTCRTPWSGPPPQGPRSSRAARPADRDRSGPTRG